VLLTPNSSPASLIVMSLSILDILDHVWILVKCSVKTRPVPNFVFTGEPERT
jgi:hypothetical protein